MMDDKIYVTKEGLDDLNKEYQHLVHVVKNEVIEDLKAARAQGDLSENADYDAARDRQAQVEARIRELEAMLSNVRLINNATGDATTVRLGCNVTIEELDTGDIVDFSIVGSVEADPLNGKISNVTPLALAILDKGINDIVEVNVDNPYKVKIISINRN